MQRWPLTPRAIPGRDIVLRRFVRHSERTVSPQWRRSSWAKLTRGWRASSNLWKRSIACRPRPPLDADTNDSSPRDYVLACPRFGWRPLGFDTRAADQRQPVARPAVFGIVINRNSDHAASRAGR